MPRGTLREPPAGLRRCHAVILSRADAVDVYQQVGTIGAIRRYAPGRPVLRSRHRTHIRIYGPFDGTPSGPPGPRPVDGRELKGLSAYAFSGIADNDDFHRTVRREGLRLAGFSAFGDHHAYRRPEIDAVLHRAAATGADLLVTTEKDHARLGLRPRWPLSLAVVGIRTCLGADRPALLNLLCQRLGLD